MRTIWYPIFLPVCKVKNFKICGWKVIVINAGQDPANPLFCKRISDDKEMYTNYETLLTRFIDEKTFIDMAKHYGYELHNKINSELTFEPFNS